MLKIRFSFKGHRIVSFFMAHFRGSRPQGLRNREEARAREISQTKERIEREEKAALEQAARLAKELKGREWVWGPNGEVRAANCHDCCWCKLDSIGQQSGSCINSRTGFTATTPTRSSSIIPDVFRRNTDIHISRFTLRGLSWPLSYRPEHVNILPNNLCVNRGFSMTEKNQETGDDTKTNEIV